MKYIGMVTRSNMTPEREKRVREIFAENKGATLLITLMSNMEIRAAEIAFEVGMKYNITIPTSDSGRKIQAGGDKVILLANEFSHFQEGYYSFNRLVESSVSMVRLCDILIVSGVGKLIDRVVEVAKRERVIMYDLSN